MIVSLIDKIKCKNNTNILLSFQINRNWTNESIAIDEEAPNTGECTEGRH